jgi:phosphosulfolactate synthase
VLDRLSGLNREEFEQTAEHVDIVVIGWGLPLIWPEPAVRARIKYFRDFGIRTCMSGTLIEHAALRGNIEMIFAKASSLGFDMVEVSDGIIDITPFEKAGLVKKVKQMNFDFLYTVGKKDPASQLKAGETLAQIKAGLELQPFKVVLESREWGRGVGIYDQDGNVKWALLRTITESFDHRDLIFEAPLELQQSALILELGPEVNLGHVALGSVAALQAERLGLRFDTFGVDRPKEKLTGGPSTKFVLFAVKNYQPIDQKGIAALTQLPRRTIQKALEDLVDHKLITEHLSFEDRRSKIYRTTSPSPMDRGQLSS